MICEARRRCHQGRRPVAKLATVVAFLFIPHQLPAESLAINIEESGPLDNPVWEIVIRPQLLFPGESIVGPNSLVLERGSNSWHEVSSSWRIPVESQEHAAELLEGTWSFNGLSPFTGAAAIATFQIATVPLDNVDRFVLSSLSIEDDAVLSNREDFRLSWSYANGQNPLTYIEWAPGFGTAASPWVGPVFSFWQRPRVGGRASGSRSIGERGDQLFAIRYRNEPDDSVLDGWIYSVGTDRADSLPLDVQLTVGTWNQIGYQSLTFDLRDDPDVARRFFSGLEVRLGYIGIGDRITVTLVPEPRVLTMVTVGVAMAIAFERRCGCGIPA